MTRGHRTTVVAAAVVPAVLLTGCSGAAPNRAEPARPLIVFAAASLQGAFDELAQDFAAQHPEHPIDPIVYDGSQALATQIRDGADVDVMAFANEASLEPVTDAGAADAGTIFATNTLQIAVAPGNPLGVEGLDALADPGLSVVLCAEEVPCGAASHTLLDDAGIAARPVSEETNVTSVAARVANGEADAGLVYATDIASADGALDGVTPSNADAAVNRYPITISSTAESPDAAEAFVDLVMSDDGQKTLHKHGFEQP